MGSDNNEGAKYRLDEWMERIVLLAGKSDGKCINYDSMITYTSAKIQIEGCPPIKRHFYFVRKEGDGIQLGNEYQNYCSSSAINTMLMVNDILLPLLKKGVHKNARISSVYSINVPITQGYTMCSALKRSYDQMKDGITLNIPTLPDMGSDIDRFSSSENSGLTEEIVSSAESWIKVLTNVLESCRERRPSGRDPLSEVAFWQRQRTQLECLKKQLDRNDVRWCMSILCSRSKTISPILSATVLQLSELTEEACDNSKFLSTLERHFLSLRASPFESLPSVISSLFGSLRMVWILSRHGYNREERMLPLLQKISNQITFRVSEHICFVNLLSCNFNESKSKLMTAIEVLDYWYQYFMKTKKSIEIDVSSSRRWEFDQKKLFKTSTHISSVCNDFLDIIESIEVFRAFVSPELVSITGESEEYKSVKEILANTTNLIANTSFDPCELDNRKAWQIIVEDFCGYAKKIEEKIVDFIVSSFASLRSSSKEAFILLESFATKVSVARRPLLRELLEERYLDVLKRYDRELSEISNIFESNHNNPDAVCDEHWPRKAAAISWALNLYRQAKSPILQFRSKNGLLVSGFGKTVKRRYLSFANRIDTYVSDMHKSWLEDDCFQVQAYLKEAIIKSEKDLSCSSMKNDAASLKCSQQSHHYRSNFSQKIIHCIRETERLNAMGFAIPKEILNIALQEERLIKNAREVDNVISDYTSLLSSLSFVEKSMLHFHVEKIQTEFDAGCQGITWNSLLISSFVCKCRAALETFRVKQKEARKHLMSVNELIRKMEIDGLCLESDVESFPNAVENPFDLISIKCKALASELRTKQRGIQPILQKLEMDLFESNTRAAIPLRPCYFYIEKKVQNALLKVIVRSSLVLSKNFQTPTALKYTCKAFIDDKGIMFIQPTISDIKKYMITCYREIVGIAKAFPRWMRGTCIEIDTSGAPDFDSQTYTHYDDIEKNVFMKSLSDLLLNDILKIEKTVLSVYNKWKKFDANLCLSDRKQRLQMKRLLEASPDSNFFNSKLIHYDSIRLALRDLRCDRKAFRARRDRISYPPLNHHIGCIFADFTEVAKSLENYAHRWKVDFSEVFHTVGQRKLAGYRTEIQNLNDTLATHPVDLDSLKVLLFGISKAIREKMHYELLEHEIKHIYEVLVEHQVSISPEELGYAKSANIQDLYIMSKTKEIRVAAMKNQFRAEIADEVKEFLFLLSKERQRLLKEGPASIVRLDEGSQMLQLWQKTLETLKSKQHDLRCSEKLFSLPHNSYTDLLNIQEEICRIAPIYNFYDSFRKYVDEISEISLDKFNCRSLNDSLDLFEKQLHAFESPGDSSLIEVIQKHLIDFKSALPLVEMLKTQAMQPRHWEKLGNVTKSHISSASIILGDLFSMNLGSVTNEVVGIVNEATQELKIETKLLELHSIWAQIKFDLKLVDENSDCPFYILRSTDEIILTLDDHLLCIQALTNSRFAEMYLEKLRILERKFHTINECVTVWMTVQQKWLYLRSIFVGAKDLRKQLPSEAEHFDKESRNFELIMKKTTEDSNVMRSCCLNGRLQSLENILSEIDICQKQLSHYLNSKRNIFSRFYFISDEELLSILGSFNPKFINSHISKMFEHIKSLTFNEYGYIDGLSSAEGEHSSFIESVSAVGQAEVWMNIVEGQMHQTLWLYTKKSIFMYGQRERLQWLCDSTTLGMNSVCCSQTWWTWYVEDAFSLIKDGNKHAMRQMEVKLNKELEDLVDMVRSDIDIITRKKVNTLLIIDVHARDVVSNFVKESVEYPTGFEWESQLRFYWDRDEDDILVKQCTGAFRYGYEYIGLTGRLVITPLTDRCYMTLTQALIFNLGGAPMGPAGTGKTETVKDLAKSLALPCFVINCGEGLDFKAMRSIFSGLYQSGAWGCFDEFNRINVEVLSVVSSQLKSIQNGLVSGLDQVDLGAGFAIRIRRREGYATSGVFITMNPGYAGRTDLPESLKALFRPVTMIVPDFQAIAENILFSEGFHSSKYLAKKMVVLYKLCKDQLSQQYHYDFGLRSMKTVLIMAGSMKRRFPNMAEEMILLTILRDANLPKYVFDDVPLFLGLLDDLFPGAKCPQEGNKNLRPFVSKYFGDNGYKCCSDVTVHDYQVNKVLQLYETQVVRHTTMLVGPTGGGKSLVLSALANARQQAENVDIKVKILNPKAQSLYELYGYMDPLTRDWTDGLLSKIFREANSPLPKGKDNEIRWLVFDGDIDALWIEGLNSVMDDNRLLTLPNGERIRLQGHCSLIFEVFDLQYASPATISRCGMVWVDPKNIGYKPFFERWLECRAATDDKIWVDKKFALRELFDRYAEPSFSYIFTGLYGEKLRPVLSVTDISMCQQLCCMLEAYLLTIKCDIKMIALEGIFVYCVLWSIGAQLTESNRGRFELNLRKIPTKYPLPEDKSLFSLYFCVEKCCWESWEMKVPDFEYSSDQFHKIIVPTPMSELYSHLLDRLVARKPVLLAGNTGTCKTIMINNYLSKLSSTSFDISCFNLSSRTSSNDVQASLESCIEKRIGRRYGPTGGKELVVFLDDVNMPQVDLYNTQQPIAFLLTLINHSIMYSRTKDLCEKFIENVSFVSAMCPSGGRNPLDPRFVARFCVFAVTEPSRECQYDIFSKILSSRFSHQDSMIDSITIATLDLFENIRQKLPPTPTKFHYIFSIHDLSRLFEGIWFSERETFVENQFCRLWSNEAQRIFMDRLNSEADVSIFWSILKQTVSKYFSGSEDEILRSPYLFTNVGNAQPSTVTRPMMDQSAQYKDIGNYKDLRCIIEKYLYEYNSDTTHHQELNIVLFESAIDHLIRLMRVLRNPRGNALLVGTGGSGKQSLTRLAAFICKYNLFQLKVKRNYSEIDFQEDLKTLYKQLLDGKTLFLLNDSDITEDAFLEYINNILRIGLHPGLFDDEEEDIMCSILRDRGNDSNSREALWTRCIETCRNNLHIVLCMSPSGDKLRLRCRNFPSFISHCSIDWYFPWPSLALRDVAQKYLVSKQATITGNVATSILDHMVFAHSSALKSAQTFCESMQRTYHITPSNFLDLINMFVDQMESNRFTIDKSLRRFNAGLSRLEEASLSVDSLSTELARKKAFADTKTDEVQRLLTEITHKKKCTVAANETTFEKQKIAKQQSENIRREKANADSALMEALPAVEAAAEALNNIRREDLQELKAFNNPPIHVKIVCQMCCCLRPSGEKLNETWADSKKLLGNARLLDLLKAYPKDEITEKMYKSCMRILKENREHDMTVENMATKSTAGKGLLIWVLAILKYFEIAKNVEPLRAKVKEMEKSQAKTEAELEKLQVELKNLAVDLEGVETAHGKATMELQNLKNQASIMNIKLQAASRLIGGLSGERQRWKEEVQNLCERRSKLVGNTLLCSSFNAYFGAFTAAFRSELLDLLRDDVNSRGLFVSEDFEIKYMLSNDSIIQGWTKDGLPQDLHSIQNGILTNAGLKFPLCIDPTMQAVTWIKNTYCQNQLYSKSMNDTDYFKHMEIAIQYGKPFLFENIGEVLDPILDPIFLKNVFCEEGTKYIYFGDKKLEWDDNFRLFLCTKLSNPKYSPEVFNRVRVINYCVTPQGLSDQLLNVVVTHERPELEDEFRSLTSIMVQNSIALTRLEDSLLKELSSSTGNILENNDLIKTLEETKVKANEITSRMDECQLTKKKITLARNAYRNVSDRGSILYFASSGLSNIHYMYEVSLESFLIQFKTSLSKSDSHHDIQARIAALVESCTNRICEYTCTGIFECHKITFVFRLACMIMEKNGTIDFSLIDFFLRGNSSLGRPEVEKPKCLKWLGDSEWKDLLHASKLDDYFAYVKSELINNHEPFELWFNLEAPESGSFPGEKMKCVSPIQKLCFIRIFRPDRCFDGSKIFVKEVLGDAFTQPPVLDYARIYKESSPLVPLIIILSPGADPLNDVIKLGTRLGYKWNETLCCISLGQGQESVAMTAVKNGSKNGCFVILQNCHLLGSWMTELDATLSRIENPHNRFRLWLTTEPTKNFPLGILQKSLKLVIEAPGGLKLNVQRTFSRLNENIPESCQHPRFIHLIFTLSFLHAVLQERCKYGKVGWNVSYDFNDSDFDVSLKLISLYLNKTSSTNDEFIPFSSIKYLIGEVIYGGRVSDNMDRRVLRTYLDEFVGDFLFDESRQFFFSKEGHDYTLPKLDGGCPINDCRQHLSNFPSLSSSAVFGLHPNAEFSFSLRRTNTLWDSLIKMQPNTSKGEKKLSREECIRKVTIDILEKVPIVNTDIGVYDITEVRSKILGKRPYLLPTQVVLLQELERWNKLCIRIVSSLTSLIKALKGETGMNQELDSTANAIFNGILPKCWLAFAPASEKKLGDWINHFLKRSEQYETWIGHASRGLHPKVIWLSGLHVPESFLTAIVQTSCRKNGWPLDRCSIFTEVTKYNTEEDLLTSLENDQDPGSLDECYIAGLFLEGAGWNRDTLELAQQHPKQQVVDLPIVQIIPVESQNLKLRNTLKTPVYITSSRRNAAGSGFVFDAFLATNQHKSIWILQGVALLLNATHTH